MKFVATLDVCGIASRNFISISMVRPTAYLNFCSSCMHKELRTYGFGLEGPGLGLAVRVEALVLRFRP